MRFKLLLLLTLVFLPLTNATLAKTVAAGSRSATNDPASTFNLKEYGAVGDGVTDDGGALQRALDAIAQAEGGTLLVPAGRYAIITPVVKDFSNIPAARLTIQGVESLTSINVDGSGAQLTAGLDLTSEFVIKTGETAKALSLSGLGSLLIKDLVFIGTLEKSSDALVTISLDKITEATIRHCEFYGLASFVPGGAIVLAKRSRLNITETAFLGCTVGSGYNSSVVQNIRWKHISVTETVFTDYGQRPDFYGKTPWGAVYSWIGIGNAAGVDNLSPRREAFIYHVFLDEGHIFGIASRPDLYDAPGDAPIDLIYISRLRMNVTNLGFSGLYLFWANQVFVADSYFGWSHNASSALAIVDVNEAVLDKLECVEDADHIFADAKTGKLTVINSVYGHLYSSAQTTLVIDTETAAEDPVQYVAQQFRNTLGREPDAAAHVYWTNRLLRCAGGAQCVADNQAALASYLGNIMEFNAANYSVSEGAKTITISVVRTDDTSSAAEVTYSATDGSARHRSDVIPVIGRLNFEPGETSKNFTIFITDDAYVEGEESLTLKLSNPMGGTVGDNGTATLHIIDNDSVQGATNPIDDAQFFVSQHYRDFLNRQPDTDGLAFWTNEITQCGTNAQCVEVKRINVSAAFFLSIEFQQTGFLAYRLYQAAFGRPPQHLEEFLLDTRTIAEGVVVHAPGWEQLLEANKTAFIEDFVARQQFSVAYPLDLTPAEFVNLLNTNTGGALSPNEVAAAVAEFEGAVTSEALAVRSRVVRRVAENETFSQRELNPAFVLMEYFGYLQRNPDEAPDTNLDGYNFWLHKLNEFGGDFRRAEMVKAFLGSSEYRRRFGL